MPKAGSRTPRAGRAEKSKKPQWPAQHHTATELRIDLWPPATHPPRASPASFHECIQHAALTERAPPSSPRKSLHFIKPSNVAPRHRGCLGVFPEGGGKYEQTAQTYSLKGKQWSQTSPGQQRAREGGGTLAQVRHHRHSRPAVRAQQGLLLQPRLSGPLCCTDAAEGSLGREPEAWAPVPALPLLAVGPEANYFPFSRPRFSPLEKEGGKPGL